MSDLAIKVEGLGKKYKIGRKRSGDLRESFGHFINKFRPNNASIQQLNDLHAGNSGSSDQPTKEFWALKDINFEVKQGEAIGIIGRNGAGKSTLLKILSRITKPTTGRFEITGRVSSLLEVGTGFHMELSGRENIYLNGTILGMKRREIRSKFDEIVAFSGVEKFIDTPVKHYSSGMKVRLAFSVAAHLEPEILIIDEVLAVGDSVFQKKCINKMLDICSGGKTVLFVSHNMPAVKSLCHFGIIMEEGKLKQNGEIEEVVKKYLSLESFTISNKYNLTKSKRHQITPKDLFFEKIEFNRSLFKPGDTLYLDLYLSKTEQIYKDLFFGIAIKDIHGNQIFHLSNLFINKVNIDYKQNHKYRFILPKLNLRPGIYSTTVFLKSNEDIQDWIPNAAAFEVSDGNIYNFENTSMITGLVFPEYSFEIIE